MSKFLRALALCLAIAVPAQAPSMDAWIQAAGEAALPTIDLTPEPAGSSDDS